MTLQELVKVLRNRWITVFLTALTGVVAAAAYTMLQTPLYESSTRLFVSASSGESATEVLQGSRYSQERVLSYTELIMGETLAQRTIDRLKLSMAPEDLRKNVTARSKPETVLIRVSVLDPSPVQARDIANALSDEFVLMVRELETPAAGVRPDVRVVVEQRATIAQKPVSPNRPLNVALGLSLGIMLGIGIAILRDLFDNTVKTSEVLEEITGASTIGYIPFDKKLQAEPAIYFDSDNSVTAEAYRKVRTNLQFLAVDHPPRVITVTSASPAEGKSTSALNIALALAEANNAVVLVDGDLRRPRIAELLQIIGSVGLSSVLSGSASLDDVLQETGFPGLTVLAAGPIPPNASELLGSMAAKRLLEELRSRFDYVIIDSSPLLAVTDGAILAAHADGAIIAVRSGQTRREHLAHAIRMLSDVGATVLGALLTMLPSRERSSYGYGYGYGYGDKPDGGKSPKQTIDSSPKRDSDVPEAIRPDSRAG